MVFIFCFSFLSSVKGGGRWYEWYEWVGIFAREVEEGEILGVRLERGITVLFGGGKGVGK